MSQIKKEPAPSANDTSSKEKTFNNSIVPEIPADVNPCDEVSEENFCAAKEHGLPTIVWEACMEKMEELNRKIVTAQSDIKEWSIEISEISAFMTDCVMSAANMEVQT